MGLRHNAIHAMLANPHLAPFELVNKPCEEQTWTLIDHLMVIHKVKADDYIEDDPQASIVNMARRLASHYKWEDSGSRCVVLVKDGAAAPKPAVKVIREKQQLNLYPHIKFCRRNLGAIEYTMMKLLADMGMKNKLFLVTGSNGDSVEDDIIEGNLINNLVSFHQKYSDVQECMNESIVVMTPEDMKPIECETPEGCHTGSIDRPVGFNGVFVATFANPETIEVSTLRDACLQCKNIEADMLLVELANLLEGSVTVCSGDSDTVAVLTASGREGITLRLENKSYDEDQDMHTSTFGNTVFDIPENRSSEFPFNEMSSTDDRFRMMCDITAEDQHLLQTARKQHDSFEVFLDKHAKLDFKEMAIRLLYLNGIRGSVYYTLLAKFVFKSNVGNIFEDWPVIEVNCVSSDNMVGQIFRALDLTSDESLVSGYDSNEPRSTGKKRKMSCLEEKPATELHLDNSTENWVVNNKKRKMSCLGDKAATELNLDNSTENGVVNNKKDNKVMDGLKRLSSAYRKGMVPRGSYGRFLKLKQAGRHFFMQIKEKVTRNDTEQMENVFLMALCGTDYNYIPKGLGIKRLMTGVVTNSKCFFSWCKKMKSLLWNVSGCSCPKCNDYHKIGLELAKFTTVPAKTQAEQWTVADCELMVKTTKYACQMWKLKCPRPGLEYGLYVRDGVVEFIDKSSLGDLSVTCDAI